MYRRRPSLIIRFDSKDGNSFITRHGHIDDTSQVKHQYSFYFYVYQFGIITTSCLQAVAFTLPLDLRACVFNVALYLWLFAECDWLKGKCLGSSVSAPLSGDFMCWFLFQMKGFYQHNLFLFSSRGINKVLELLISMHLLSTKYNLQDKTFSS